jgi:hypothetical protein
MTSLHQTNRFAARHFKPTRDAASEQRTHRRYDLGGQTLMVNRWDASRRNAQPLGYLVDLSAGGARIRTEQATIKADSQIRVRLELPSYAGICPFIETSTGTPQPKNEWVGWLAVTRVKQIDARHYEVAVRLVDL